VNGIAGVSRGGGMHIGRRRAMSYKPKYLGHVNIFVRNVERSQKWYADVLGLHTYDFRPGRAAFMSADLEQSHEIALIQVGEDASGPQERQVGLNHMAWMMSSLEDLKELYQRLKDKNAPIDRVSDHGISIGIYLHDPDGNGIEVSYELPRSQWPRQDKLFSSEDVRRGRFPGPWDEHLAEQKAAAR
jgi:catechol 2,3-dioxygenase